MHNKIQPSPICPNKAIMPLQTCIWKEYIECNQLFHTETRNHRSRQDKKNVGSLISVNIPDEDIVMSIEFDKTTLDVKFEELPCLRIYYYNLVPNWLIKNVSIKHCFNSNITFEAVWYADTHCISLVRYKTTHHILQLSMLTEKSLLSIDSCLRMISTAR